MQFFPLHELFAIFTALYSVLPCVFALLFNGRHHTTASLTIAFVCTVSYNKIDAWKSKVYSLASLIHAIDKLPLFPCHCRTSPPPTQFPSSNPAASIKTEPDFLHETPKYRWSLNQLWEFWLFVNGNDTTMMVLFRVSAGNQLLVSFFLIRTCTHTLICSFLLISLPTAFTLQLFLPFKLYVSYSLHRRDSLLLLRHYNKQRKDSCRVTYNSQHHHHHHHCTAALCFVFFIFLVHMHVNKQTPQIGRWL